MKIFHINKREFAVPSFADVGIGGSLASYRRRCLMLRTKGEPGTGEVVEAVRHIRRVMGEIRRLQNAPEEELMSFSKESGAPFELVLEVKKLGALPVINFAAGGIATPADAALMLLLGADGIFIGSGIFKSSDPEKRARAIVEAAQHYEDPERLASISRGLGEAMPGMDIKLLDDTERMQIRGT